MASGGTRALAELRRAGVAHATHEYGPAETAGRDRKNQRAGYGEEAAAALGVDRERIHKTLVVSVDGRLAVAVVPVAAELDLKAFADAVGGRKAAMAEPADAERATGYVRGGISPLGLRRRLPTVVDAAAGEWATIYVSAGRRGLQVELAPDDLIGLTAAVAAPIARR